MTPSNPTPRRPGRPVSQAARRAVLDAATGLLEERGFGGFSIDEVARRSRVSKATIYKHWTGRLDLALEAYGGAVTGAVPVRETGDAGADLRDQIARLAAFYASPRGHVAGQLIAAGTLEDGGPALVRDRFFAQRRGETAALIDHAKARGEFRVDVDTQLTIDLLFGPIVFRLLNGLGPLGAEEADRLADAVILGLSAERAATAPAPGAGRLASPGKRN